MLLAHTGLSPVPGRVARGGRGWGLVVLRTAQVGMGDARERRRGGRQPEPVEAMFEDRVDMPVGARADGDGAGTRGLEAGVAVAFGEAQDAQARAVALLGVRPVGRMASTRAAVCGPMVRAQVMKRDGDHSRWC